MMLATESEFVSFKLTFFCPSTASQIGKFDTETKETVYWDEENCWPSEPVFVTRPNGESEDDGESSTSDQSDY